MSWRSLIGLALVFVGLGMGPEWIDPALAAKPPKRPKASFVLAHTQSFPPCIDAAVSTSYHPGVEVFAPNGGAYHSRELFEIPGYSQTERFEMRYLSGVAYDGPMGLRWWHSLHGFLRPETNGDVTLFDTDGRPLLFTAQGQNYVTPVGCCAQLLGIFKGKKSKLKGWTLTWPDRTIWTFDRLGVWKSLTRRDGRAIAFVRDKKSHALKSIKTPEKRKYTFKYGKDKRLVRIRIPGRRDFSFVHDTLGNLIQIQRPLRATDVNRAAWTYSYDAQNRLETLRTSAGEVTAVIDYDGSGRVAGIADADGKRAAFTYSPMEMLRTGRDGVVSAIRYDVNGQSTSVVTEHGTQGASTVAYEHDPQLRRTATVRAAGDRHEYVFATSTDPRDGWNVVTFRHLPTDFPTTPARVTTYTYRPGTDQHTSEVRPDGGRFDFAYDGAGNPISITSPGIKTETGSVRPTTQYEYDGLNRRVATIRPTGDRHEYVWGAKSKVTDLLVEERIDAGQGNDPNTGLPFVNQVVRYSYDALGRLLTENRGAGVAQHFEYDAWNSPTALIDELGNRMQFTHDAVGRIKTRSTPFLDEDGDPIGNGTRLDTFTYDALGRVLEETSSSAFGSGRKSTKYEYAFGHAHPSRIISPRGLIQDHLYDGHERPVRITSAVGTTEEGSETFTYDLFGNQVFHGDGAGKGVQDETDGFGRIWRSTDAESSTTEYEYDSFNRVTSRVRRNAQGDEASRTRYLYDSAGNGTETQRDRFDPQDPNVPTVVETETKCYDLRGFPVLTTDACGATTRLTYDGADRVLSREEQPLDKRTEYEYDALGRPSVRRVILGVSTATPQTTLNGMEYDAASQLVRTTHPGGEEQTFEYDSLGNGTVIRNADGRIVRHSFDAYGCLLASTETGAGGGTSSVTYSYDLSGNVTQEVTPTGVTKDYVYDSLNRLVREERNGNTVSLYEYDAAGNPIEHTNGAGQVVLQAFDARGRVVGRTTSGGGAQSLVWDANDNLLSGNDTAPGAQPIPVSQRYDSLGNQRLDLQPAGQVARTWGNCGTPATLQTPDGFTYAFSVDAAKRVFDVKRNQAAFLASTFKAGTRDPQTQTNPELTTTFTYDAQGNRTNVTNDSTQAAAPDSSFTATYDTEGRLLTQIRNDGRGERFEYDDLGRLSRHFTDSSNPASTTPTAFGILTTYAYAAQGGRLASIETVTGGVPKGPAKVDALGYDGVGRIASYDTHTLTYAGNGHATNWFEHRPAYDPGERLIDIDPFGRVTRVRRGSDQSLVASFGYDVLGRPVISSEEEFSGNVILDRFRVFLDCLLISEFSPTRLTGSDGFDLTYMIDFNTNRHVLSGFQDSFVEHYLLHTDCRGMPAHAYSPSTGLHNESYLKWTPQGLPLFEAPEGTPFRGAPSLSTIVNAPGFASSPACGLIFDWVSLPRDPNLPRPLDLPAKPDNVFDMPFPFPPGPPVGPGGGEPLGEKDDNVNALPDSDANQIDCEKALDILERTLANLQRLEGRAFKCKEELITILHMQQSHISKIETIVGALGEINDAQASINGKIALLQSLDASLSTVTKVVDFANSVSDVKNAAPNFKTMGTSVAQLFGGATGSKAITAQLNFARSAGKQSGKLLAGFFIEAGLAKAGKKLDDIGLTTSELGLSKAGSVGYNLASDLNRLTGGKSLLDMLAAYDSQIRTGNENLGKLRDSLEFLQKIELDRLLFKSQLRDVVAGNCEVANQQLSKLKRGWGGKDAADMEERLKAVKADLARQGML